MSLEGKTILITGAARRIGASLAQHLARAGADIILHHSQSPKAAEETAEDVRKAGRQAWVLQADFSDPHTAGRLIDQAWRIQPFHALINNAAIFEPLGWNAVSVDDWQRTFNINLSAPFFLSQGFARCLKDQPGRIVNILDWRALRPADDHLPYTISKAGLTALTRSLAIALAPHITVNGLALGTILPPAGGGEIGGILQNVPLKRWAELSEVGQAVEFLLDGPDYITGEIIHLDGGRHLI